MKNLVNKPRRFLAVAPQKQLGGTSGKRRASRRISKLIQSKWRIRTSEPIAEQSWHGCTAASECASNLNHGIYWNVDNPANVKTIQYMIYLAIYNNSCPQLKRIAQHFRLYDTPFFLINNLLSQDFCGHDKKNCRPKSVHLVWLYHDRHWCLWRQNNCSRTTTHMSLWSAVGSIIKQEAANFKYKDNFRSHGQWHSLFIFSFPGRIFLFTFSDSISLPLPLKII